MKVEELTAVRQTLQSDLETSIKRIVDLQAALEEESSDESDTESTQAATEPSSRKRDLFVILEQVLKWWTPNAWFE
nr:PREDICTED: unconventional myosin-XVIIIb-like isoform X2 [Latimeria chalumnae]|eukprot:XP_006014143.1 PREDICTED: unconventional myosin-XVIIIb-like isoform X2 [Latimeria chalumnae]